MKALKFVPQVEARVLSGSLTHLSYIITSIVPKAPHSDFSIAPLTLMLYWSLAWPLFGWRSTQHLLGVRGELEESFCTVRILRDFNLLNLDKYALLDGCNWSENMFQSRGQEAKKKILTCLLCLFCAMHPLVKNLGTVVWYKFIVSMYCSVCDYPLQESCPVIACLSRVKPICYQALAPSSAALANLFKPGRQN